MDVTVTVDDSEAPLFVFTYPSTATLDEIKRVFTLYDDYARAHRNIVWVVDLRLLNPLTMPPSQRKAFAEEFERHRQVIESATIGEARVVSSSILQGIVTAVDWLTNRKYPVKNFTDLDSAKTWGRKLIAKATPR
jgi:hypothetical protein